MLYEIEIGHPDPKKNHAGRKLLAHGGKVLVGQLKHNQVPGDRVHIPVPIPAGDYSIDSGDVMDGGNFKLVLDTGAVT